MRFYLKVLVVLLLIIVLNVPLSIYADTEQTNTSNMDQKSTNTTPESSDIIFVSKNGSDYNNGFTLDKCKRTVQNATFSAKNGDTIIIYPGTYKENINIRKNIKLIGTNPKTTIIDGMKQESDITTYSDCAISNFTIQNGKCFDGGGVYIANGRCKLENCIIKKNKAEEYGGGVYVDFKRWNPIFASLFVNHCDITDNSAGLGGGIATYAEMDYNDPWNTGTIINNTEIHSNHANIVGGGIENLGGVLCINTKIKWNIGDIGSGIGNGGTVVLINSKVQWNWGIGNGIHSVDLHKHRFPVYCDKKSSVSFNWPFNANVHLENMERAPFYF